MTTNFEIGKRYRWKDKVNGGSQMVYGILKHTEMRNGVEYGVFQTNSGYKWFISLGDPSLEECRKR